MPCLCDALDPRGRQKLNVNRCFCFQFVFKIRCFSSQYSHNEDRYEDEIKNLNKKLKEVRIPLMALGKTPNFLSVALHT